MNVTRILSEARQLLTKSAQEDSKTSDLLESKAAQQYFEQRHLEVAEKFKKADADFDTHTTEGSWISAVPLVGHPIVVWQSTDSREKAKDAEGAAGDAEVSGELYKKSMEDFQDLGKRAGEAHQEILEMSKTMTTEFAAAQRSIFEK